MCFVRFNFFRMTLVKLKAVMYHHFCPINKYGSGLVTVISDLAVVVIRKLSTKPLVEEMRP